MSGNISGISSGLGNFIVNNKILCLLTFGLAILGIVVGGKCYSWIQKITNSTTQRTERMGREIITQTPTTKDIPLGVTEKNLPTVKFVRNIAEEDERLREEIINNQTKLPDENDADYVDKHLLPCFESHQHEIIPHVFVGDYSALKQIDPKQGDNPCEFTRVISATQNDPKGPNVRLQADIPETVHRIAISVEDNGSAWSLLENRFSEFFEMINNARAEGKNILIHCMQGQSRSVTIMMAYLIHHFHATPEQVLHYIRTKRIIAGPAEELYRALEEYHESIRT